MSVSEASEQAARRLAAKQLRSGYEWQELHTYTSAAGEPLYWRIRLKDRARGEKWIRPLSLTNGQYELKEPVFPDGKPLYRLHELAARPDEPVLVVEGEWCADHLAGIGILATTSGAADSVSKADWQPLAGRTVIIWPDHDEAGARYAAAVTETLGKLGCLLKIVEVAALDLPAKGDAVDWLAKNPGSGASDVLALPMKLPELDAVDDEAPANDEQERTSQTSKLVAFVESHAALFHDMNGEVYAQDNTSKEVRRINSSTFRDWLAAGFYESTGNAVRDQSVREALSTMAGRGRIHGERREVHIRVAVHEGDYFLDLGEEGQSRVVRITAGRWEVISDPPVMFLRTNTMRPLPVPEAGGDISNLWRIANIPEECRLLVLAWLCECLRPDTPFPVLELIGEQGSAKSTTQTALRKMLDPNACDLRGAPKAVEDVYVSASANWLVSYENISHLSAPMQDALCTLATGGGFAKRKLYSDADESVITVKRPIVLNGISVAVTAQDLVDRTVSVEMPAISERCEITSLLAAFEKDHGQLLGALLTVMAGALQHFPDTHLPKADRPRLAEFARLGVAIEKALAQPAGTFMRQFNARREEAIARTIDASPVAAAVVEWFEKNREGRTATVKEWLFTLEREKPLGCDAWPRSPKGLGDALRRAAPALRQMGIECRALPKLGGVIRWEIKPREKLPEPSPASPACPVEVITGQDFRTFRTLPAPVSSHALESVTNQ
jgi:hypothetical protein